MTSPRQNSPVPTPAHAGECPYGAHVDHNNRIERSEDDIQDLWKAREQDRKDTNESFRRLHGRIDGMKNWIVAGMGSMLIYFLTMIANVAIEFVKKAIP